MYSAPEQQNKISPYSTSPPHSINRSATKKIILTDYLNRQSGQFAIKELIDIKKIKTIVPIFHKTKK